MDREFEPLRNAAAAVQAAILTSVFAELPKDRSVVVVLDSGESVKHAVWFLF